MAAPPPPLPAAQPRASDPAAAAAFPPAAPRPPLAAGVVILMVAAKLGLHLATVALTPYGLHRDEFLYLAMGKYLQLWRMDFPPLTALLANLARGLLGDSLLAIRFFPAVAGALLVLMAALLARELGGGRGAQTLAMLAVLLGPLFLRPAALFQPVVLDQLWWTLGFYVLARLGRGGGAGWWLFLGLVGGVGLLTKFSILFFGVAVLLGLLLSPLRGALLRPGPWVAVGVALLIGSPSWGGQLRLGFPVVGQMRDLRAVQLERITPLDFLAGQALLLGPALLLALAGLLYLLLARGMRPYRALGWASLAALGVLMLLQGKAYYAGPIYPLLLAAGARALEAPPARLGAALRALAAVVLVAAGVLTLPMGLPLLPPAPMARYAAWLGVAEATTTNTGVPLALPQDYADMLGWEARVRAVARVYQALPPEDRARAVVLADNYGEAGALDFYGPRHGLPRAVCPCGSYWYFGPGARPGEVVVALGVEAGDLREYFRGARTVLRVQHRWAVPEERDVPVTVARSPYRPLQQVWPEFEGEN